jgi:ABC-type glycerol-3-phosphate transport system substrate-binding protein
MSDADTYDLIAGHGRYVFKGVLNGFYMDWNQLEYVNLDAPWWSQSAREEWTTTSKRLYMMNGDLSYMSVGSANVMYFNRDVFSNAKITTPYEHVKNDNWTLETFEKSVRDADAAMVGDGSGLPETDTFGYGTEAWRGPIQAVYSAGVSTFAKGGDCKFSISVTYKTKNSKTGKVKYISQNCVYDKPLTDKWQKFSGKIKLRKNIVPGELIIGYYRTN